MIFPYNSIFRSFRIRHVFEFGVLGCSWPTFACVRDVVTFRGRSNENFREETGYQLGLWVGEQSSYAELSEILLIFLHFCMLFLWILYQVTMPKDSTEVSCCVKYLLFFFNVFFWVSLHNNYNTNIHIMVTCWQVILPSRGNEYKSMHNTITWYFLLPVWITWCYKFNLDK